MPISLMILDFQMPRKNGLQVIEEIRTFIARQNRSSAVKIKEPFFVMLTAYSTSAFIQYANKLKILAVYEKPLRLETLAQILENCKN